MIASIHLADDGPIASLTRRAPRVATVDGLRWSGKALCGPLSKGALPHPQLGRGGAVCWWDDDAALDAHLASAAGRRLAEGWTVRLRPIRTRAVWPNADFTPDPDAPERHDGVHAAITLGTAIYRTLPRFLKVSAKLEEQFLADAGGLWGVGITVLPRTLMTLTMWEDQAATDAFVRSGAHGQAMDDHYDFPTDNHDFITEGGFFGFQPYAMTGTLTGPNAPPAGLAARCA